MPGHGCLGFWESRCGLSEELQVHCRLGFRRRVLSNHRNQTRHFSIHEPRVCSTDVVDKRNVGDKLRANVADKLRRYTIEVVELR
jgi:hypothetical protein